MLINSWEKLPSTKVVHSTSSFFEQICQTYRLLKTQVATACNYSSMKSIFFQEENQEKAFSPEKFAKENK